MYVSMASAALLIEWIFQAVHLVPQKRHATIVETAIRWNYTSVLNIVFLTLALVLLIRFFRSGGLKMLKMMDEPPDEHQMHHG